MKIHCPSHEDSNPSMHLYEDWAHCFVCNYRCPIEEVASAELIKQIKKEPEDKHETIRYIDTLPLRPIRGLNLPADERGYYIVWPDRSFYKKRTFGSKHRYMGPRGSRPPFFCYPGKTKDILVLVEGEINALSLYHSNNNSSLSIGSFGGIGNIMSFMPIYLTYRRIIAIVDKDDVGVAYGVTFKREMLKLKRNVELVAVEEDYNDVLVRGGTELVKKTFKEQTCLEV